MIGATHSISRSVQTAIGRIHYHFFDRHYIVTVRGLLIAACLGLTVLSVVLMRENPLFGLAVVAGMVALAFMLFAYRRMALMCLAVLVISTMFDVGVGSGTGTDIKLVLVLLLVLVFLWTFRLFVVERSVASVQGRWIAAPALLFSAAVVISLVWSMYYVVPAVRPLMYDKLLPRLMTALVLMISPLTTLLFANHLRTAGSFKFIVLWFVLVGALKLPFEIAGTAFLPGLMNTGGQFAVWVGIVALGQALFNRTLPRYLLLILLAVIAGWLYVAVGMRFSWLSGWVPLVGGLGLVVFLRFPRLMAAVGLVIVVVLLLNFDAVQDRFADESLESGVTRMTAGQQTLRVVGDHFLFGTGPAGYYFYLTIYIGGLFQLSHNNYLDIIAQTGLFGFALYLWFWAGVGWYVLRAYQRVPRGGFYHGLAATLASAYIVTLGAMLLGDWVTPFAYTQTLGGISYTIWHWMLAGAAVALYYQARRLEAAPSGPAPAAVPHRADRRLLAE